MELRLASSMAEFTTTKYLINVGMPALTELKELASLRRKVLIERELSARLKTKSRKNYADRNQWAQQNAEGYAAFQELIQRMRLGKLTPLEFNEALEQRFLAWKGENRSARYAVVAKKFSEGRCVSWVIEEMLARTKEDLRRTLEEEARAAAES